MKKYVVFFGALLVLGIPSTRVDATGNRYVSVLSGMSAINPFDLVNHSTGVKDGGILTGSGFDLAVAVGKRIDNYKVEVEFGRLRDNTHQGHISVTSYMVNGYCGCPKRGADCSVDPYITAGIGLAEVGVKNVNFPPVINDYAHPVLAYQFGLGVAVPVAKNIAIDCRYRFCTTSKVTMSNKDDIRISSNNYLVGIRVNF